MTGAGDRGSMEIIVSHNHLDFDGLASMVAAKKLYPQAELVFVGGLSANVQQFMALHKDTIAVRRLREIALDAVRRVVVVDTHSAPRLGELSDWIVGREIDIHFYDHHTLKSDRLHGSVEQCEPVGATVTLLVEKIQAQKIQLSGLEATLLALGIYEDTGRLTFSTTTARDARAVAFLLERGANLEIVSNFIELTLDAQQKLLLNEWLNSITHYSIKGLDIAIASAIREEGLGNLDFLAHKLSDVEGSEVLICIAQMGKNVYLIVRSRSEQFSASELCSYFGGGGHPRAASATIKRSDQGAVLQKLHEILPKMVHASVVARDIMSTPVKTITPDLTIAEAGKLLLRYGHTGFPVVEDDKIMGMITRRDIEKARMHKLEHAPVKGFMARKIVFAGTDTPLAELQKLMVLHDIGRVPILAEDGKLIGLVSRTDVLKIFHGEDYQHHHVLLYEDSSEATESCQLTRNIAPILAAELSPAMIGLLRQAGEVADSINAAVYIVGGFVRDILMQVKNFDVDFTVEINGIEFAQAMGDQLSARVRIHKRFGTAVLVLPDGFKIDIATARREFYEFPAALPRVERATLRQDLYRRDFTINAIAVQLNGDCFGDLIDFFGGEKDLRQGMIRILHSLSFIEDPTRIIRAIRFEQRYNFQIEEQTLGILREAVAGKFLSRLSPHRIRTELVLILQENNPVPTVRRMVELAVMDQIAPMIEFNHEFWRMLNRIPKVIEQARTLVGEQIVAGIERWIIYWLILFHQSAEDQGSRVIRHFHLPKKAAGMVETAYALERQLTGLGLPPRKIKMSTLHGILKQSPPEIILYLMARTSSRAWQSRLLQYLRAVVTDRPLLSGEDLKQKGIPPGPIYSELLKAVASARFDGLILTREEEEQFIDNWLARKEGNNEH